MALPVQTTRIPKATTPTPAAPFTLATGLDALRTQRGQLNNQLRIPGSNVKNIQGQLGQVRQGILTAKAAPPVVTPPAATPTPDPGLNPFLSNPASAPTGPAPGTTDTLFPNERMFEPQNYQGSPLYQFQLKAGQDQLAKSLASRGLTDSGYGITQEVNVPLMAAAQDTDRIQQNANNNADRLATYQQDEAARQERAGNNQWDRTFSLAQLMAGQSPWAGALAGLNNTADITNSAGTAQSNYLKDAYNRIIASGGGGGSRGSGTQPVVVPSGPDYSNITPTQIGGDFSSNKGWIDLFTKGLSNLF